MTIELKSPEVTAFSWGEVTVAGYDRPFKDVKIYPGGAREWDWSETGTRHVPGIQPADVQELLDNGAAVIILTKGVNERLQTCTETIDMLKAGDIPHHILQTEKAIALFNELRQTQRVGILIHSTC